MLPRDKYGLNNFSESLRDQNDFTPYIEDVLKWHRQPPTIKQVYRISNVAKWPEKDGAWEVARVRFRSNAFFVRCVKETKYFLTIRLRL